MLQFGHDLEAVENPRQVPQHSGRRVASIRPRPGGRGERSFSRAAPGRATPLQFGHDLEAVENDIGSAGGSRRPTGLQFGHDLEAVENAQAHSPRPGGAWRLQFGHDLEAVENRYNGTLQYIGDRLQFGHDLEAVENGWKGRSPLCRRVRFNSATTWRPLRK